eukprot:scaffold81037_cov74-Phaeocystis_antarctica.AAC.2
MYARRPCEQRSTWRISAATISCIHMLPVKPKMTYKDCHSQPFAPPMGTREDEVGQAQENDEQVEDVAPRLLGVQHTNDDDAARESRTRSRNHPRTPDHLQEPRLRTGVVPLVPRGIEIQTALQHVISQVATPHASSIFVTKGPTQAPRANWRRLIEASAAEAWRRFVR